jgi:hypothetical protein
MVRTVLRDVRLFPAAVRSPIILCLLLFTGAPSAQQPPAISGTVRDCEACA